MTRIRLVAILSGFLAALAPAQAGGQTPASSSAGSTRAEIEAAIAQADLIIKSPGYSSRIKQAKRREAAILRARLNEGDLQPGDQIILSVQGQAELTDTFTVTAGRFVTLPGVADVSVKGVLRSELEEYMTSELRKYLRDPIVHVQTTVRLSVLGSVGRPGFYQVKSEMMVGDALMAAGGPTPGIDPNKTRVERGGAEVMSPEVFAKALADGRTLDQMNLRAGDEILVGGSRTARGGGPGIVGVISLISGLATATYFVARIF